MSNPIELNKKIYQLGDNFEFERNDKIFNYHYYYYYYSSGDNNNNNNRQPYNRHHHPHRDQNDIKSKENSINVSYPITKVVRAKKKGDEQDELKQDKRQNTLKDCNVGSGADSLKFEKHFYRLTSLSDNLLSSTTANNSNQSTQNLTLKSPINKLNQSNNLINLPKIDLDDILDILTNRFLNSKYYTEVSSSILIALNPYKNQTSLYSSDLMNLYNNNNNNTSDNNNSYLANNSTIESMLIQNELEPHVFKFASNALKQIRPNLLYNSSQQHSQSQTILVSGDSGSGKTFTINYIMSYFAHITKTSQSKHIESMLLYTNPILEAFGNASTVLNENSSRFGKYIELYFNTQNGKFTLCSAKIITYLLEKMRAIRAIGHHHHHHHHITSNGSQKRKERNFHIFYEMMLGANREQRIEWHLNDERLLKFYLNDFDLIQWIKEENLEKLKTNEDWQKWQILKTCLKKMKLLDYTNDMFRVISALAHLNCCFSTKPTPTLPTASMNVSKLIDSTTTSSSHCCCTTTTSSRSDSSIDLLDQLKTTQIDFDSNEHLKHAADLLGFSLNELENYLFFQELNIKLENKKSNSIIRRACSSLLEIKQRKDTLAKFIYSQLFKLIVNLLNECLSECSRLSTTTTTTATTTSLESSPTCSTSASSESMHSSNDNNNNLKCFIGLLDIYGFEDLNENSLEQLCINYANEKLHQAFVDAFYKLNELDYLNESVEWTPINYKDNINLLNQLDSSSSLINNNNSSSGSLSLFSLLNEECFLRRDIYLNTKLMTNLVKAKEISNKNLLFKIFNIIKSNEFIYKSKRKLNGTKTNNNSHNSNGEQHSFTIRHYAGDVEYKIDDLIEKNKDSVPDDLIKFLFKSSSSFLRDRLMKSYSELAIINEQPSHATSTRTSNLSNTSSRSGRSSTIKPHTDDTNTSTITTTITTTTTTTTTTTANTRTNGTNNKRTPKTMLTKFKNDLDNLILKLKTTKINYIRCIMPNNKKSPSDVDKSLIKKQLEACGIVSILNMTKLTCRNKFNYFEFCLNYIPIIIYARQNIMSILNQKWHQKSFEDKCRFDFSKNNFIYLKKLCSIFLNDKKLVSNLNYEVNCLFRINNENSESLIEIDENYNDNDEANDADCCLFQMRLNDLKHLANLIIDCSICILDNRYAFNDLIKSCSRSTSCGYLVDSSGSGIGIGVDSFLVKLVNKKNELLAAADISADLFNSNHQSTNISQKTIAEPELQTAPTPAPPPPPTVDAPRSDMTTNRQSSLISNDKFKFGKRKIFLNDTILDLLNLCLSLIRSKCASKVQAEWRMYSTRRSYLLKLKSIRILQDWFRYFIYNRNMTSQEPSQPRRGRRRLKDVDGDRQGDGDSTTLKTKTSEYRFDYCDYDEQEKEEEEKSLTTKTSYLSLSSSMFICSICSSNTSVSLLSFGSRKDFKTSGLSSSLSLTSSSSSSSSSSTTTCISSVYESVKSSYSNEDNSSSDSSSKSLKFKHETKDKQLAISNSNVAPPTPRPRLGPAFSPGHGPTKSSNEVESQFEFIKNLHKKQSKNILCDSHPQVGSGGCGGRSGDGGGESTINNKTKCLSLAYSSSLSLNSFSSCSSQMVKLSSSASSSSSCSSSMRPLLSSLSLVNMSRLNLKENFFLSSSRTILSKRKFLRFNKKNKKIFASLNDCL